MQIKIWKKDQKDTTLQEEWIEGDGSDAGGFGIERTRRQAIAYEKGEVGNLPANSKLEAEIVVVNEHHESDSSNIISFETSEGGEDLITLIQCEAKNVLACVYRTSSLF